MKQNWLNKKNNSKLIVFFNGWGMDKNAISHLECDDFDIYEINDYRTIENIEEDFSRYHEKYLMCWSMGVMVSNLFKAQFNDFNKKIAISGTCKMIDDSYGIPSKIYNFTIKHLKPDDFVKSIADNCSIKFNREYEELKQELVALKNIEIEDEIEFNKAIIPLKDKIVPPKNQLNFWQNKNAELEKLNCAHYIFDCYKSWQEIICWIKN